MNHFNWNNFSETNSSYAERIKLSFVNQILTIFSFLFFFICIIQPAEVPTKSMAPTIKPGDFMLLSKVRYGWNLATIPFGLRNGFKTRDFILKRGNILPINKVDRGDIVSIRHPSDLNLRFIKRVIAVGNDRIQVKNGIIHINGQAVQKQFLYKKVVEKKGYKKKRYFYRETLINGKSFITKYNRKKMFSGVSNTPEYVIPQGHIFLMGDNRDNSNDSRGTLGIIPVQYVIGSPLMIFFSKPPQLKVLSMNIFEVISGIIMLPKKLRYKRILTFLK